MEAGLASPLFWGSLAVALAVAFAFAFPVNYWLIRRGKGHAVVHEYHGATDRTDDTHAVGHGHGYRHPRSGAGTETCPRLDPSSMPAALKCLVFTDRKLDRDVHGI